MNKFKRVYKMPLRVYDEEIEDFHADIIVGMTVFFNAKGQPMKGVLDTNEYIDMVDGKPFVSFFENPSKEELDEWLDSATAQTEVTIRE